MTKKAHLKAFETTATFRFAEALETRPLTDPVRDYSYQKHSHSFKVPASLIADNRRRFWRVSERKEGTFGR